MQRCFFQSLRNEKITLPQEFIFVFIRGDIISLGRQCRKCLAKSGGFGKKIREMAIWEWGGGRQLQKGTGSNLLRTMVIICTITDINFYYHMKKTKHKDIKQQRSKNGFLSGTKDYMNTCTTQSVHISIMKWLHTNFKASLT